jgi:hypothetical protein
VPIIGDYFGSLAVANCLLSYPPNRKPATLWVGEAEAHPVPSSLAAQAHTKSSVELI